MSCCQSTAYITVLTLFLWCSGGSGAKRRQCREAVFHVQEPDEDPQQEEQTAQDGMMMMMMMMRVSAFKLSSTVTFTIPANPRTNTFKHRYSQFHFFL